MSGPRRGVAGRPLSTHQDLAAQQAAAALAELIVERAAEIADGEAFPTVHLDAWARENTTDTSQEDSDA